jgi:hypothetical protein
MNRQNTDIDSQPVKWQTRFVLFLRWLGGGLVGLAVGLLLFVLSESGEPPVLGPIIAGQQEFFDELMFYLFHGYFGSSDSIYGASILAYSAIWVAIGALLMSGRRKQIKTGAILFLFYITIGFLWYLYWAFRMIPT